MENPMNQEKPESQSKEQFRVVINREANEALEAFVVQVNAGGETFKVAKSDLANYVFSHLNDLLNANAVAEIRAIYFDAKKALEGILKGSTDGSDLPQELREALLKHCGIKSSAREKRPKKLSTPRLVDNPS